ncbi:MAG: tRNA lysidine(34) synthetase TilS [Eubacteriaceae bacterium]
MFEKVLNFIEENRMFSINENVLIGVSGGPDSVALLNFMFEIKTRYNFNLYVAHINHMLRADESDKDEEFVEQLCEKYSIVCYSKKIDIKKVSKEKKISVEEAGREERYNYFKEIKEKLNIDKIALAHHKNDNVETIFMRIIRGTGIKGLKGIDSKRADGVVRPFLCLSKEEVLVYCEINNLHTRLDKSNLQTKYHRNKLRIDVIPNMEKLNPNFTNNINNLGKISKEYYDFVQIELNKVIDDVICNGKIELEVFNNLHSVLRRELLIRIINKIDSSANIDFQHIQIILDKVRDDSSTTWSIDLPRGIKIVRQYKYLILFKEDFNLIDKRFKYEILPDKTYIFTKINMTLSTTLISVENIKNFKKDEINQNKYGYFDYDKIKAINGLLLLRSRKDGDRIEPIGILGTKKIKDIFIDKKIPVNIRWKIPILSINNEIIWVLGYHKSRKFSVSKATQRVLMISFNNN